MKVMIKYRKLLMFFIMLIFAAGVYSYYYLPKQEAANISAPVAIITTIYPGASQQNVEELVTNKIEDKIKTISGYSYSISYSNNSVSTVVLEIAYGTDTSKAWQDLRNMMQEVQPELPDECYDIQIRTNLAETAGIIIALYGENYSYESLSDFGEMFTNRLSKIEGVTRFEMDGKLEKELWITIDTDALNRLNLSFSEITQMIMSQNLEIPSGLIENEDGKVSLNIVGSFEDLSDIENMVIGMSSTYHSPLKLKDIAEIGFRNSGSGVRYKNNGENAILLTGYFEEDQNILIIGDEVRLVMDEIAANLPSDLSYHEVLYQPTEVKKSIDDFMMNLIQGIVLVIVVVFVGMGFRNAIIVSTAIPLSIVMTFITMYILNIPLHMVSIIALIVALGMLVDNAIVVSDAIQNRLDEGEERMEACVNGAKEVLVPVFSSTLTTVATLSPLLMLNSIAGEYIASLPLVVIVALIASFIIAVIVTPTFAYMFFKPSKAEKVPKEHTLGYKFLGYLINHKMKSFLAGFIMLALLGSTGLLLDVIFFPKADKDIMYIDIVADKAIDLAYTDAIASQIEALLETEAGVVNYATAIGGGLPKFFNAMGITAQLRQNAQIMFEVDLDQTPYVKNTMYAEDLQAKIDAILIGGKATVKELENAFPMEAPINIRFVGEDLEALQRTTNEIKDVLNDIEGTKNVRTNFGNKKLEYAIDLDQEELYMLGLTKYDVLNEISIALSGREVSTLRMEGQEYPIYVEGETKALAGMTNLMVKSSYSGDKYLVGDIGEVFLLEQLPTIQKYDGERSITVHSDVKSGYLRSDILKQLNLAMGQMDFSDITYVFDGEDEQIMQNFGSAGVSAIFAVFAIYTILLIQFKDFKEPLIILFTVPLSSAGAIFGLYVMNQPISFTGLIGIVSLIGIVVNNAIVLLDYINMKRREGMDVKAACVNASIIRLRPIMLSTITTISGLIPLLVSNSELFKPMAVALVFGLLISTMLTLVFIPLTYSIAMRKENI